VLFFQRVVGSECQVTEPRYGYQFDLRPLRLTSGDYHVRDGDYDYVVNVCGALVEPGKCGEKAGACQNKSSPDFTPILAGNHEMDRDLLSRTSEHKNEGYVENCRE